MKKVKIKLDFNKKSDTLNHKCESKAIGDWIEWTCPQCPRYKRSLNRKTKKMIVEGNDVQHINHFGDNAQNYERGDN